jgi:lipoprotein-releasing system permease protein
MDHDSILLTDNNVIFVEKQNAKLNLEFFISKRLFFSKENKNSISKRIAKIAVFSISLSLSVMICSIVIVTGFKNEIQKKIAGFEGHIQILNYDSNISYETVPIDKNQDFYPSITEFEGIKHIQQFALYPGIIKTKTDFQGVVLKGVGSDYNWAFFNEHLVDGKGITFSDSSKSNQVLISKYVASLLKLKVGDKVNMYFVQDPPRRRRFTIAGIYETSMVEMDKIYVICDIKHVQRLNKWDDNQISGFEVIIDKFTDIDFLTFITREMVSYQFDEDGAMLRVMSIKEKSPQIFDWLGLFDLNVIVIIFLMLAVAAFNMISGLLILVLERTNMIGIMKAMGAENLSVRKIFLYLSGFLTARGLLWGNIIAIGVCLIQLKFQILKLDPSAYFLDSVPINFHIGRILLINLITLAGIMLILIIPSTIITKISPVKTIRFD